MPDIIADAADIDDQIAVARETLRELIEQAAAYSGAADDDLVAQRIADQEARIELMTKRRKETLQSTNSVRGEET
jgi:hypothetical protein